VSDRDDFRARATEIFRQLRSQGGTDSPETEEEPPSVPAAEDPPEAVDRPVLPEPPPVAPNFSLTDDAPANGLPVWPPEALTPDLEAPSKSAEVEDPEDRPWELLQRVLSVSPTEPEPAAPAATAGTEAPPTEPPPPPAAKTTVSVPTGLPATTLRLDPLADIDLGGEGPPQWTPGSKHPGSSRPLPRILAIANQKGGVGKTTTAVNLGAALAELHYRVLVVDLDPQGNATTGLGINGRNLDASVYDVILHETPIEDVIEPTTLRNLFVVPATIDLAGAEIELVPVFSREMRLRKALDSVRDDFDFMLIDCPPSLGLLTVNGLAAATEVVVPIQCEYYALEGLSQLLRNVNLVQGNLNAGLELSTIILTMYDARTRLAEQVVGEVRSHFGARVCRNVVPRTVRLSEAPSFGQPIIVFDSSSRGAIAYRELAKEVSGGAPQRVR
jgi:chromosome partitioning protein